MNSERIKTPSRARKWAFQALVTVTILLDIALLALCCLGLWATNDYANADVQFQYNNLMEFIRSLLMLNVSVPALNLVVILCFYLKQKVRADPLSKQDCDKVARSNP